MRGDNSFSYRGAEPLGQMERGGVRGWCLFGDSSAKAREMEDAAERRSLDETLSLRDALCYRERRKIL